MNKIIHCKFSSFGFVAVFSLALYIFNKYFCVGNCYVNVEDQYLGPLFMGGIGLSLSLFLLLFFSEQIFISWLKHIGWWYLLGVTYFIFFVSSENQSFLSPSHSQFVLFFMAILFIITLIYALVMNRRLKKNSL